MFIKSISVRNFRNLSDINLDPSQQINLFYGKNAQGKTSILEAIYVAAYLKSFRSAKNEELIKYKQQFSKIEIVVINSSVHNNIDITLNNNGKTVTVNQKKPKSYKEFFNYIKPVFFSSDEVSLIKSSPSGRRSFLDRAVFNASSDFIEITIEYNKYLRQRNFLLKNRKRNSEIEPWTSGLIKIGIKIRLARIKFIKRISPVFKEVYQTITSNIESADLSYPGINYSESDLIELLKNEFINSAEKELVFGQTIAGPHRDEPIFTINERPLRQFASQGQQRSFVLAFKIAQIIDLEHLTGETPILLLDDVASELDSTRQEYFFKFLLERSGQVFITTTDIDHLLAKGLTNGDFFEVNQGKIRKISP